MKKLLLISFCLGLLLLAGQTAWAANTPACIAIGGTCQIITCTDTATPGDNNYTLDSAFFTTDPAADTNKAACITEFEGTTKECTTEKCEGAWYNVCCKTASGCNNPNSCEPTGACSGADQITSANAYCVTKDSTKPICCKPQCLTDNCKTSCAPLAIDTTRAASCGPEKECCKVGSGTKTPVGGTTQGDTFPLKDLSPVGDINVQTLIGLIIKGVLGIVGSIALLMFVYGGFLMLVSQGDPGKIKKGKDTLIWAAAGLVVIFGSYIFVSFILAGLSGK